MRPVLILGAASLLASCSGLTEICTTDFRWGIVVEVRDAVTGANAVTGARLIVRDGDYVETVDEPPVPDYSFLRAAGERAGRYGVTVQKPSYQEWTRSGVWVRHDGCHVIPVALEARLQPAQMSDR